MFFFLLLLLLHHLHFIPREHCVPRLERMRRKLSQSFHNDASALNVPLVECIIGANNFPLLNFFPPLLLILASVDLSFSQLLMSPCRIHMVYKRFQAERHLFGI